MATDERLLTTGEAAVLLGSSRQHVVDLCDGGLLPYLRVGTHRRLRRADIEAVLRPELTRDQLKALWLHRAVAGHLVADPHAVLDRAATNLDRLCAVHPAGMTARWLEQWRAVLAGGAESVLEALTSRSAHAVELRQNSPFAGCSPRRNATRSWPPSPPTGGARTRHESRTTGARPTASWSRLSERGRTTATLVVPVLAGGGPWRVGGTVPGAG